MRLEERSFSSEIFRPTPEIHTSPGDSFIIVATPWGPRSSARKAIDIIQDFFLSASEDQEATSPFQKMTCLSPMANNLRAAIMMANDCLYREDNKDEYLSGVELFAIARKNNECAWAQVGNPSVFLSKKHCHLIPIGYHSDLSLHLSPSSKSLLPPLPGQLIGLHTTSNILIQSFRPSPEDKLILLSRSLIPSGFTDTEGSQRDLSQISNLLSQQNPSMPFWLGMIEL